MNTLPKKYTRWLILLAVLAISLITTFIVINNKQEAMPTIPVIATPVAKPDSINNSEVAGPVKVKLNFDYTNGYVDVFITNTSIIEHGELVLKLVGDTAYSKIEEDTLFERYLTSSEVDKNTKQKSLRVGATKGIEGSPIQPGISQKFARLYFNNLKTDSVLLDTASSSFFVASGNPTYQVELEQ